MRDPDPFDVFLEGFRRARTTGYWKDWYVGERGEAQLLADARERWGERRRMFAGYPQRAVELVVAGISLQETPAIGAARTFLGGQHTMLVLSGPPGAGKTLAATWWAWHRPEYSPPTFGRTSEFAVVSRYDAEARARWYDASSLVLDDVGAEYLDKGGSLLVDLDALVDAFYASGRSLLLTTNLPRAAFEARYGERIADRMREVARWVGLKGPSLRGGGKP